MQTHFHVLVLRFSGASDTFVPLTKLLRSLHLYTRPVGKVCGQH